MIQPHTYELGELTKEICQAAMIEAYRSNQLQCQHIADIPMLRCVDPKTGFCCMIGALPINRSHFDGDGEKNHEGDSVAAWTAEFITMIRYELQESGMGHDEAVTFEAWLTNVQAIHDSIFVDSQLVPENSSHALRLESSMKENWDNLRTEIGETASVH